MEQSKLSSFIEAVFSTVIGFVVAITAQMFIFPLYGIYVPMHVNFEMGGFFTIVSVIRSYIVRRWFNARLKRAAERMARMAS